MSQADSWSERPTLVNEDEADALINCITSHRRQMQIRLLMEGVRRFCGENPTQLRSPFDLKCFVQIVLDQADLIESSLDGSHEAMGWWEEEDFSPPRFMV